MQEYEIEEEKGEEKKETEQKGKKKSSWKLMDQKLGERN